ncbi:MAG: polysaccharide deacetylase family protein [Candidatus Hodarchaeales archaeon]
MNKPVRVCLTFDFDAESVQVRQLEELGRVSKGQFAVKRGISRILSLLNRYNINATFFVCGWVAETYPELTQAILDNGHEIAAHGYLHEYFDKLSLFEEKEVFNKTDSILREFTSEIKGFRAPFWKLSSDTLRLVADTGYIYDSSLFADDRPYILEISDSNKNLVEFPVEWFLDDWVVFEEHQHSPSTVLDIWKSQFEAFLDSEDISDESRVFQLTCHPAAIGHAYRLKVLEQLIVYMKSFNTIFSKMGDVAELFLTK